MGLISFFDRLRVDYAHGFSLLALSIALLAPPAAQLQGQTFSNPLFSSQDPYVTFWNGNYYYTEAATNEIRIRKSPTLTGLKAQIPIVAWKSPWVGPDGHANVWAPEIHQISGVWYIYYAADFQTNGNHRLYVLQGGPDPMDPYVVADTGYPKGQLVESTGKWAIDPDVFYGADGQLYLVWSCTTDGTGTSPQNLCLARMSDALHISSATSQIASPTQAWETRGGPIEEGPIGFVHDGKTYLTYSASASWTPNDYTVGALINSTGDLLDPKSWIKHGPIFDRHGGTFGPGSVVFVPSADGTELWSLYHAYDRLNCAAWACRSIRMQKVSWDAAGLPILGYPMNPGVKSRTPSGDPGSPTGWGDSPLGTAATGKWSYNSSASLDTLPGGDSTNWQSFRGNSNPIAYTVSAQIQIGGLSQAGLYASHKDAENHVDAFLDTVQGAFVTCATVAGRELAQRTFPFAPGFDISVPHEIRVAKTASGRFVFLLDGILEDQRDIASGSGQVGVFANSVSAHFQNVSVVDTSFGWGDAYGDAAEGLAHLAGAKSSMGYVQGNWTISDGGTVESSASVAGWNTIYQGNPNFANFTVQVDAQLLSASTSSSVTSFGIGVCHDDRNNQLTLWIDPVGGVLTWTAVVARQSTWESAALPSDFNVSQPHRLAATKTGSSFTFYLDGVQMGQGTYELANGTSGLVTENAHVKFQRYSVVDQ
jgi:GH43 family beta-xylosidase